MSGWRANGAPGRRAVQMANYSLAVQMDTSE